MGNEAETDNVENNENLERDADFSLLDEDEAKNPGGKTVSAAKFDAIKQELAEAQDKHLRLLAEFDNYKKRTLKERSDFLKYQGEQIFFQLLDIVDNFELALQHKDANPQKLKEGVELIHKLFKDILTKWEVRSESAIGQSFDPIKHNAISKVELEDQPAGTVIQELKPAYYYKDRLIRAADVVVAAEKANPEGEAEGED